MTDKKSALKTLHTRLVDAVDGYEQALEKMEGPHKPLIERCLSERRASHAELHPQLAKDGIEVDEDGSTAAAIHRQVFNIRDAISGGDKGILAECARGDEHLLKAYDEAIEETNNQDIYGFLTGQRAKVAGAIDELKSLS